MIARSLGSAALAAGLLLLSAPMGHAVSADLFFSEYVEGSSVNKYLEIYNGTGSSVDLGAGGYGISLYLNGSSSAYSSIALSGTIADGDVFVVGHELGTLFTADQGVADFFVNGDDAVSLYKGVTTLDVIGQIGFDPGSEWGTDPTSTANNTLRRKASVLGGDSNGSDIFDPSIEWEGYAIDTVDGLGSHSVDVTPVPLPAGALLLVTAMGGLVLRRRR